jgi:hypothetical protein
VAEKLPAGRLDALALIGVDEVSYGADHKFLTSVVDHQRAIVKCCGSRVSQFIGRRLPMLVGPA